MSSNLIFAKQATLADWPTFFANVKAEGSIPDYDTKTLGDVSTTIQSMYVDLDDVKQELIKASLSPTVTTIYADVVRLPPGMSWSLKDQALVIFARLIISETGARINLDYKSDQNAKLVLFTNNVQGTVNTYSITSGDDITELSIVKAPEKGGVEISCKDGVPSETALNRDQGLAVDMPDAFRQALQTEFLYGAIIYDQHEELALSMMHWLKDWGGLSDKLIDTFLRASALATLLSGEINAKENGAAFVPYLTKDVYTSLAAAYVQEARDYETKFLQLSTVTKLTENDIKAAEALRDNKTYESAYISAVTDQAKQNYDNATAAAENAFDQLQKAQQAAELVQIDFEKVGVPEWKRAQIVKAIISLGTAVITFAVGIGSMFVGNAAGGAAAASGAASAANGVAEAAGTAAKTAKLAKEIADVMKELKKLVDGLTKIATFLKAVVGVAQDISSAASAAKKMSEMDIVTGSADLSATTQWQIFDLRSAEILKGPVEKGVGFAKELKLSVAEIAIYGQALSAAQLAEISTGQEYARLLLQKKLSEKQQSRLDQLISDLKVGEKPNLEMMQEFYRRYVDIKSSLFAAIKGYQAAYRYWALRESSTQPRIIEPVDKLDTGLKNLTAVALDYKEALTHFVPPPQILKSKSIRIDDESVLEGLKTKGKAKWTLPFDLSELINDDRIRLNTVRFWLEQENNETPETVRMSIISNGNYLDRYKGSDFQFTSKPFKRVFEYRVKDDNTGLPDWKFKNGDYGYVVIDGRVDDEVKYAYFEPTPFGQWEIELSGGGRDNIVGVTMEIQGSVIGQIGSIKS